MLRISCPSCGTVYTLDDGFYEKAVVCQRCTSRFQVTDDILLQAQQPQELVFDTGTPEPEPEPVRRPPPPSRRRHGRQNKSIAGPAIVIGLTVLVVGAVVIASIIMLIRGFSEDDKQSHKLSGSRATRPLAPQYSLPEIDPNVKANFIINTLDGADAGLTVLRPAAPLWPVSERPTANNQEEAAAVAKVKRAAVLIKVEHADGEGGTGSGFFALEPGLIVTNAHVVGMMKPSDPPPTRLEVVINSGEANETKLRGTVVAVDRRQDLALIRVKNANLPEPLPVISSTGLTEAQEVYIAGWPFASQIGTNVSISKSSISSLRKENGTLRHIQTLGGMNPGNSGGPVVDGKGRVVGVSVSILRGTDINFAVPTDYIGELYRGSLRNCTLFPAAASGHDVLLPLTLRFDDALGRIGKVQIEWWMGSTGAPRPAGLAPPPAQAGDTPRQTTDLTYQVTKAVGQASTELKLPALPEGKVYWLQIVTTDNKDNSKRWYAAQPWKPKELLQRHAVTFASSSDATPEKVEMLYRTHFRIRGDHSEFPISPVRVFLRNDWETEGTAKSPRKVTSLKVGARASEQVLSLQQVMGLGMMNSSRMPPPAPDDPATAGLNAVDQFLYRQWSPFLQSLSQATQVPSPEGAVDPVTTPWSKELKLAVPFLFGKLELPKIKMGYQLLGTEKQGNREVAVVRLDSAIQPTPEAKVQGQLWALARVDVATGKTVDVYGVVDLEAEKVALLPQIQQQIDAAGEEAFMLGTLDFRWKTKVHAGAADKKD